MVVQHSTKALLKISGLLTATEAGRIAGVEPGTVVGWIRMGLLPATRFGTMWVVTDDELRDLLKARNGQPV